MSTAAPQIQTLTPAEIAMLVGWAADEGWNPGLADAALFRAADPAGFLGAFIDGEMVAGMSAVAYDGQFGFIGLYICRPDMRGRGYGKALWDAGMARLGGRTIGLDAVPAQQANYRSMGFLPFGRTFRFSGRPATAIDVSPHIRPIAPAQLAAIIAFDQRCFPAARPDFLRGWLAKPHVALAYSDGEAVHGYGVARRCREGFKIGPLFAEHHETAISLLGAICRACDGEIHIDVPDENAAFGEYLLAAAFSKGFETTRMYRGARPQMKHSSVFGVTTLELG